MQDKVLLIVDDEPDVSEVIEVRLESLGCSFKKVFNAEDAYKVIKEEAIDCVLCDIILPKMSGVDLIKKCREEGISVPFIFYSGQEREKFMQDVLKYGAFDFIVKPDLMNLEDSVLRAFKSKTKQNKVVKEELQSFFGGTNIVDENIEDEESSSGMPIECVLGIESIDEQHLTVRKIFLEIEEDLNNDGIHIPRYMKKLNVYFAEHLAYEEQLFDETNYPNKEEHIFEHKKFLKLMELFERSLKLDKDAKIKVFIKFKDYIFDHLMTWDAKYVEHFKRAGIK